MPNEIVCSKTNVFTFKYDLPLSKINKGKQSSIINNLSVIDKKVSVLNNCNPAIFDLL